MSPYELPKTAFLNFAPVSFETGCLLVLPENNKDLLPSRSGLSNGYAVATLKRNPEGEPQNPLGQG
jgi:hypothetical protein